MPDTERKSERWRGVIAALQNPRTRRVLAELILVDDITPPSPLERTRAISALRAAGMIDEEGRIDDTALRALLAERPPAPTGVDRWLRDGRIDSWPADADDREELLAWAVDRVIAPDERLDERTVTDRSAELTRDPLRLRRALVDAGLVEREADGTDYRRAVSDS